MVANGILSEDKINEIVLNNVYGQDRIEYCNKVSEILGMDEFVPENMFRYQKTVFGGATFISKCRISGN